MLSKEEVKERMKEKTLTATPELVLSKFVGNTYPVVVEMLEFRKNFIYVTPELKLESKDTMAFFVLDDAWSELGIFPNFMPFKNSLVFYNDSVLSCGYTSKTSVNRGSFGSETRTIKKEAFCKVGNKVIVKGAVIGSIYFEDVP